jgi:radical SAM protein with 4Fe4S-binding SPASM domain
MKPFQKVYLEITSRCNLACSFCPPTARHAEFIAPEEFRRRLREVRPFSSLVALHVKGEPLLHPQLGLLLDLCREEGIQAVITTNGTLIAQARGALLGKPALKQVNLSLHSFDAARPAKLAAYLEPLLAFAAEAAAGGTVISFRLWNGEAGKDGLGRWQRGGPLLSRLVDVFPDAGDLARTLAPGAGIRLAERIYLNRDLVFDWPDPHAPEDGATGFCHGLRTHVAILVDGTVVPCCLDGEGVLALGNVQEAPFAELIDSVRARQIKEGFSQRRAVEDLCRRCGYRKKFG